MTNDELMRNDKSTNENHSVNSSFVIRSFWLPSSFDICYSSFTDRLDRGLRFNRIDPHATV